MTVETMKLRGRPAAPGLAAGPLVHIAGDISRVRATGSPETERASVEGSDCQVRQTTSQRSRPHKRARPRTFSNFRSQCSRTRISTVQPSARSTRECRRFGHGSARSTLRSRTTPPPRTPTSGDAPPTSLIFAIGSAEPSPVKGKRRSNCPRRRSSSPATSPRRASSRSTQRVCPELR